jgi:hypothetical protein
MEQHVQQSQVKPGSEQSAPRTSSGPGNTALAQISAGIDPTKEFPSN